MDTQELHCHDCSFTTKSIRKLKRHAVLAHAQVTFQCPLCPFISSYQSNIYHHMKNIHGIARNYHCDYCNLFVKDSKELLKHKKNQHPDEYQQETANAHDRYMKEFKELAEDQGKSRPTAELPKRAKKICSMARFAPDAKDVKNDEDQVPDDDDSVDAIDPKLKPCRIQRTYVCGQCGMSTRNPRDFLYHSRDAHGEKLNIYECDQCLYASRHYQKLQRHIGFVHAIAKERKSRVLPPRQPVARKSMQYHLDELDDDMMEFLDYNDDDDDSISENLNSSETYEYPKSVVDVSLNDAPDEEILEIIDGEVDEVMNLSQSGPNSLNSKQSPQAEGEFKCSTCHFKSKSKLVVKQHEKVAHLKKKFYRCSKCKYVTHVKGRLNKHMQTHGIVNMDCRLCDFSCSDKVTLNDHMKDHSSKAVFKCNLCTFIANSRSAMANHIVTLHKDLKAEPSKQATDAEVVSVSVDPANILFEDAVQQPSKLQRGGTKPKRSYTKTKKNNTASYSLSRYPPEFYMKCGKWYRRKLKCQFCAFRTSSSAEIHDHEEHHYQENGEAVCPLCRQRFSDITQAKQHVQDKHGHALQFTEQQGTAKLQSTADSVTATQSSEKPLKCNFCPYEAKWMSEMLKHNRIHTQEKPFECYFCRFRSRWKGDMTRHLQKYHEALCRQRKQMGFKDEDNYRIIDSTVNGLPNDNEAASLLPSAIDINAFTDESEAHYMGNESLSEGVQVLSQSDFQIPKTDDGNFNGMPNLERYAVKEEVKSKTKSPKKGNARTPHLKKRYQCPRCEFSALTASRFHVHMVGHMNQRPFMCSECHYRSNWQWDITKHIRMKVARGETHVHATLVMLNECGLKNYEKYKQYVVYEERPKPDDDNKNLPTLKPRADSLPCSSSSANPCFSEASQELGIVRHFSWKCKKCDFKAPKKKEVVNHLAVHTKNGFFCGECGLSSRYRSAVERHCRSVHGIINVLENDTGTRLEETGNGESREVDDGGFVQEIVEEKALTVGNSKENACTICPFKCKNVFDMRMHMRLHQPQPDAIFKCMFCPFYTSLRRSLLQHMKLHVSEPQEYISQAMENSYAKSSEMTEIDIVGADSAVLSDRFNGANYEEMPVQGNAMLPLAGTKKKRYNCDICPYASNSKTQYLYHKQFHRNSKTFACKCPYCNYAVTRAHLLLQHIKLHKKAAALAPTNTAKQLQGNKGSTAPRANPVDVVRCGAENLTIHSNVPTQKKMGIPLVWVSKGTSMLKMYKCRFCPHVNKRRSNIREHEKMHRKRKLSGKFNCPYCTYVCSNQGVLSTHVKVHQNTSQSGEEGLEDALSETVRDGTSPDVIDDTSLDFVDFMDTDYPQLENEATVGGADSKPIKMYYYCDLCPARFTRPGDVTAHKKFHGANLSWKCKHCSYTAKHKPHLHRHSKVHALDYQFKNSELKNFQFALEPALPNIAPPSAVPVMLPEKKQGKNVYKYDKRHQCHVCPAAFLKPSSLAHHQSLHGGKGRFKCHHCDYAVRNVGNLVRHMKIHGSYSKKVNRPARPSVGAGESFSSAVSLASSSPRKEPKRFTCPKCPAVFHKWTRFDVHYRLHGCQQRFTCHSCDYSVKFMANLIKHQKIHENPAVDGETLGNAYHGTPDEMPTLVSNEQAQSSQIINGTLQAIQKEFGELSQAEQQMVMLLQHQHQMSQQQHLGEDAKRFFFCDRCPYHHNRKDAVISHLKRHYTSRDMKCPYCDYSTTLPSFLRNHTKLHFQQLKIHRLDGYLKWDQMDVVAVLPGGVTSRIFKDTGEETIEEAVYDNEPELVTIDAAPSAAMLELCSELTDCSEEKDFNDLTEEEQLYQEQEKGSEETSDQVLNGNGEANGTCSVNEEADHGRNEHQGVDAHPKEMPASDDSEVELVDELTSPDAESRKAENHLEPSEKANSKLEKLTTKDEEASVAVLHDAEIDYTSGLRNGKESEAIIEQASSDTGEPDSSNRDDQVTKAEGGSSGREKSTVSSEYNSMLETAADFIGEIAEEVVVQTSDVSMESTDDNCVGPM